MKAKHWVAVGVALVIVAYLASRVFGTDQTGGFNKPPYQPQPDSDLARLTDPHPDHPRFCQPEDHHRGYVYTPHRYPRAMGGEITAVIHRGFSPMRVPDIEDAQWLIAPPSEVAF